MALNAAQVRVALTGHIYFNPDPNAPDPESFGGSGTTDPNLGKELGYTTDDGVTFNFSKDTEDIMGWQSMDPLRKLVTAEPKSCSYALRQLNRDTWLATFGGSFSELRPADSAAGTGAVHRWEPDIAKQVSGRLYVVFEDEGLHYAFGFRRANQTAEVEFQLVRNDAVNLNNEWTALATSDGKKPWFMDTDDPAMAAA